MQLDIVGEDAVTQAIIERLVSEFREDFVIGTRHPARGGQIIKAAPMYNALGIPIFLLTDLDNCACAPLLIEQWFGAAPISQDLLFRVACDEAESWLMADREGFANWLGINVALIPESEFVDKRKGIFEIKYPFKPSLYMMMNLASKSKRKNLREGLTPKSGANKGPAYNSTLLPFISNDWDIQSASANSYSLSKAIERLQSFKI